MQACQQLERGRFARAVAAEQRKKFAFVQLQGQAFHDIGQVFVILEPEFPRRDNGFRVRCVFIFFWDRLQFMRFCIVEQPVSAVADGNGAGRCRIRRRPDAHGGGHGEKHRVPTAFQLCAHVRRRAGAKELAAVHDGHARGKRERFFQAMLGQNDRCAEFSVDFAEGGKEIRRGNRVKLARRLVENQDFRLKHHHGREV